MATTLVLGIGANTAIFSAVHAAPAGAVAVRQAKSDGSPPTVIGVMAYHGPFLGVADAWLPSRRDEARARAQPNGWRWYGIVARLREGVTVERARVEAQ